MKNILLIIMTLVALAINRPALADECLEGDCSNGRGKGFTDEGKIYTGEWRHGQPHGQGRLFIAKDKSIEGRWQEGKLVEENKGSWEK